MLRRAFVLSAAVLLMACDDSETSVVAGSWVATEFTITETGQPVQDVLAGGGGLTINITSNNTTSGTLTIPAAFSETGSSVSESMAGSATVAGNTVTFEQDADTFVRDMTWAIVGNTLVATQTFAGVTIDVTLTRQ